MLNWLEEQRPVLDKNQLRRGWKYLARRAADWKLELEQANYLKLLEWDSLLPELDLGRWRIVPITDAWALRREALERRHCADQYLDECIGGTSKLFSVRNATGKSVATIGIERFRRSWRVFGFRGFANRDVPEELVGLDREVLRRYVDLERAVGGVGLWLRCR